MSITDRGELQVSANTMGVLRAINPDVASLGVHYLHNASLHRVVLRQGAASTMGEISNRLVATSPLVAVWPWKFSRSTMCVWAWGADSDCFGPFGEMFSAARLANGTQYGHTLADAPSGCKSADRAKFGRTRPKLCRVGPNLVNIGQYLSKLVPRSDLLRSRLADARSHICPTPPDSGAGPMWANFGPTF